MYEAEDPLLGRKVRVRRFEPAPGYPDERERAKARFLAEVDAAARLFHRSLPAVLDSGDDGDVPYAVLEAPAGQSLREVLELGGPPRLPEALEIARQLLSALVYAHGLGVVHGDLEMNAVYVTPTGQVTVVGAHRPLPDAGLERDRLTGGDVRQAVVVICGLLLGTPEPSARAIEVGLRGRGVPPRLTAALADALLPSDRISAGALLELLQDPGILDAPSGPAGGAALRPVEGTRLSRAVLGAGLVFALACGLSQIALIGVPGVALTLASLALGERLRAAMAAGVALLAVAAALAGGAG